MTATAPGVTFDTAMIVLRVSDRGRMMSGGTITHDVYLDGRWIGWVGDHRPGHGMRRPRRWWAAHREENDTTARWNTSGRRTRQAALDALVTRVQQGGGA